MANLRTLAVNNELASRTPASTGGLQPGTYSNAKVVVNASGNVQSINNGPQPLPSSGAGWVTLSNGDIQQYGSVAIPAGAYTASAPVVFPRAFATSVKSIVTTPDTLPGTSTDLLATSAIDRSLTGFTAYANTGFTDQDITNAVNVDWIAIGN